MFRKAYELDNESFEVVLCLGIVLVMQDKYDEALNLLLKAYKMSKALGFVFRELYEHLGDVYLKKGEKRLAIKYYKKGLKCRVDPVGSLKGQKESLYRMRKKLSKFKSK